MSEAPDPVEAALQRALALGEDADWRGMADHLESALEDHPDDPYLLCWLGVAEREMGLDTVAYEHFKRCLGQQPEDPHVLATAGNAVAAFDDPDAESALRAAAMMAPRLPLARWMYGAYLAREGMLEEALEELRSAAELAPDEPVVSVELGVALALDGDTDQAVEAFDRAARLDPDDGWVRVLLGLALVEEDRLEEAARELSEGARRRPEDVEAQLLAAVTSAASGHVELGYEMLERARQRSEGLDERLVAEAEEKIGAGAEAAGAFLRETLAPGAFRERLMTRP
ncbi:MAG: tetratricopeptide repeat protein [Gemmatimonadetes bacterium]|nr:tetratricopeptide repeat protein [Gemmatimonadota bacterium]NIR81435.1 tetratricopeptide repeat protein [Gemmatimonadota bacterium]NIT90274.1 tetratricopeptide repeat protein [Gemmatimonadota bacterium]NIU34098.1 tetratricopeptide repeat protein [Gemmatimonadota bacterium]NIU38255.1 tetratricopeptide repeat protein [Gemmatimonadota bacterium]